MATEKGLQRQYAEGLHEPRNRKERRQAESAFIKRVKKKYRRKKRQKAIEAAQEILLGLAVGVIFVWMLFFAEDPDYEYRMQQAQEYMKENEPMIQAINSDHMIPLSEYGQYLQERQAYIDAEEAENEAFMEQIHAVQMLSGMIEEGEDR